MGRTRGKTENSYEMSVCLGGSLSWRKGGGEGLRGTAVLCANPDQTPGGSASFAASGDISVLSRHHAQACVA